MIDIQMLDRIEDATFKVLGREIVFHSEKVKNVTLFLNLCVDKMLKQALLTHIICASENIINI